MRTLTFEFSEKVTRKENAKIEDSEGTTIYEGPMNRHEFTGVDMPFSCVIMAPTEIDNVEAALRERFINSMSK